MKRIAVTAAIVIGLTVGCQSATSSSDPNQAACSLVNKSVTASVHNQETPQKLLNDLQIAANEATGDLKSAIVNLIETGGSASGNGSSTNLIKVYSLCHMTLPRAS